MLNNDLNLGDIVYVFRWKEYYQIMKVTHKKFLVQKLRPVFNNITHSNDGNDYSVHDRYERNNFYLQGGQPIKAYVYKSSCVKWDGQPVEKYNSF